VANAHICDKNLALTSGSPLLGALPGVGFLISLAKAEQFPWSQREAPYEALQHSQVLWISKNNVGVKKKSFISGLVKTLDNFWFFF